MTAAGLDKDLLARVTCVRNWTESNFKSEVSPNGKLIKETSLSADSQRTSAPPSHTFSLRVYTGVAYGKWTSVARRAEQCCGQNWTS